MNRYRTAQFYNNSPIVSHLQYEKNVIEKFELTDNKQNENKLNITKSNNVTNLPSSDPKVWGPSMWLSLHIGSLNYPIRASDIYNKRMQDYIVNMPLMIPCNNCKEHAELYISSNLNRLNNICSSRDELFKFFVYFHNQVNTRHNKSIMGYEDALRLYTSNNVQFINYN